MQTTILKVCAKTYNIRYTCLEDAGETLRVKYTNLTVTGAFGGKLILGSVNMSIRRKSPIIALKSPPKRSNLNQLRGFYSKSTYSFYSLGLGGYVW